MKIAEKNKIISLKRKNYIWNFAATIINASEAVLVLAFASRLVPLEDVGILTFGFVVANVMLCISKYGVRNYQVSDVKYKYKFTDYFITRLITIFLALISLLIFIFYSYLFNDYSLKKLFTIIVIILIYQVDAFEDVFSAELQRKGRLDLGAMVFSFRWLITIAIWIMGLFILKNILASSFIAFLFDLIFAIIVCCFLYKNSMTTEKSNKDKILKILKECFPLCAMMTLSIYIPNAAKYTIDLNLGENIQAIYGYISMPIFVLDVVSVVMFQPLLLEISQEWNKGQYKLILRKLFALSGFISMIALIYSCLAFFVGIPFLSLLYGVNLNKYKSCFMLLVAGSVALAFLGMIVAVMTVMRKQYISMLLYFLVSLTLFCLLNFVFSKSSIIAITIITVSGIVLLTTLLGLMMLCILFIKYKKSRL